MRILLLTASLDRGGAETHVFSLAAALAARGHGVTVASAGGALARELTRTGARHVTLPLDRRDPAALLLSRRGLWRLIRSEDFAIIHSHARIPSLLVDSLARRAGIPLVTTVHARFQSGGLRRRLSRWGTATVAVGEDLKQYLCEEYGIAAERIRVIPNGIDVDRFSPMPPAAQGSDKLCLVSMSRLDRDCSRVAFLLCRIAPMLAARFPQLEVVLAGGGDASARLRREAERVNEALGRPILRVTGHIEDPSPLLRAATVFTGVSRAALEAMACGVPTILAGDEGFLGILTEDTLPRAALTNFCGRGGGEVTEEKLSEAVLRLLSLPTEERRRLGALGVAYVREKNSLAAMMGGTEDFYGAVEAEHRRGRMPARTLLCGFYGYGNTGDDALLRNAIRRATETFPDGAVAAMTAGGRRDSERFGVPCIRRTSLLAVRRAAREADCLVFGGGTLLQDTTSLRSLVYYWAILRYAQRRGVRTELWGNGLGAPRTARGEGLMRAALAGCDYVGLRDGDSLAIAERLLRGNKKGASPRLCREEDLAAGTAAASEERIAHLKERYGLTDRAYAIVALRGSDGAGYRKTFSEWLATLPAEGITPVMAVMFPAEDEALSRRLCEALGGITLPPLAAEDLVGLMRDARLVCGMRLHALVFAFCAGTPFVGFGGDPKIESFCREHGGLYVTQLYRRTEVGR